LDLAIIGVILALVCSIVAILLSTFGVTIEWKSLKRMGDLFRFLEHESEAAAIEREEQGNIGDQLEEWMLRTSTTEDGKEMDNLTAFTNRIGHGIAQYSRFAKMQVSSADARHFNRVDEKVFETIKANDPQVHIASRVLEELGLGDLVNERDLPYVINKYGHLLGLGQVQANSRSVQYPHEE